MGRAEGNTSAHPLCLERERVEGEIGVDSWAAVVGFTGCSAFWKEYY